MATDSGHNLPQLVQALDEVARWREDREAAARVRLGEVAGERQRLEADIEELRRQIETLGDLASEIQRELSSLPGQETRRTRAAVDEGIAAESQVVAARDELYAEALKAREDRVAELLAKPDMGRLIEEYEQFQDVEPTLGMLPAGYRSAILAHHETVKERLRPVIETSQAPLEAHRGTGDAITVVASLNPRQGAPEALAVLLPVPYAVYEEWGDRGEDLGALLAYRVVGAIGATLRAVGAPDAPIQFADYRGSLAIQVWLGDEAPEGDLKEAFVAQIDRMRDEASELSAVGLELYTAWLDPEVVMAAEGEEPAEPAEPGAPEREEDEATVADVHDVGEPSDEGDVTEGGEEDDDPELDDSEDDPLDEDHTGLEA